MRGSHQDSLNHQNQSHRHHQNQLQEQKQGADQTTDAQQKDESRLARVKRVLLGRGVSSSSSGPNGNNNNNNPQECFGQELELVERHNETGVPLVVHRLCSYIESHGSQDPGLFRPQQTMLAIRLRLSFERRGDADLEGTLCPPSTAAFLLRQYLQDLPRPVVSPSTVSKLIQLYSHERGQSREHWIQQSHDLLVNELPPCHYRLLGYLLLFIGRCFDNQQTPAPPGICGIFAPLLLPHLPPATVLMRDLLIDAKLIFYDIHSVKDSTVNGVITTSDCRPCKDSKDDNNLLLHVCPTKPPKRKDRRDSCGQERKLIRSNSEEKIWEKRITDENNPKNSADTIRRVSSHEDFNSAKHQKLLAKLQKEMGHGFRNGGLPLQERTNLSPVTSKISLIYSPSEAVLATEKFNCDAERLRNSERFSRSITPRGRRQVRRKKLYLNTNFNAGSSKENENNESEKIFTIGSDSSNLQNQSFLEMLNSGPSRSPSPVRPAFEQEDANNPTLANWSFQNRQGNNEIMSERVEAMVSPRNSVLIPRRFYSEEGSEEQESSSSVREYGLKSMVKQINSLKKKIKKYEGEFEDNFGYRPSHSDKMSNRDIKKIICELNKVRKEHKILKEGFLGTLLGSSKTNRDDDSSSNVTDDKYKSTALAELVQEIDRKLADKRLKFNRPENIEDLSYEQLMDEKTAVQKALLHIENTLGRAVSKDDRTVVRPLYDRYRSLKRLLIRAGMSRHQDSMSELATILEHETMDFSSNSGTPVDCDRRASEPDMSHRGILDCIDAIEPTDSDSQHSSSESSRGIVESLHFLSRDELLQQQRVTKEERKRLRRALKELEMQFEARAGRRMKREDRGSQVNVIYDSYKQTKAKLRLISALLAKNS